MRGQKKNPFSMGDRGSRWRQATLFALMLAAVAVIAHGPNRAWAWASSASDRVVAVVDGLPGFARPHVWDRLPGVSGFAPEAGLSSLLDSLTSVLESVRRTTGGDGDPEASKAGVDTASVEQVPAPGAWLPEHGDGPSDAVRGMCRALADRLSSVDMGDCLQARLVTTGHRSVRGRPLVATHVRSERRDAPRVVLLGGHHGDELTSVTTTMKWIRELRERDTGVDWFVFPAVNPDGVLARPASRTNANGVDLNRNFPAENWRSEPQDGRARYNPGNAPASEPETRMLMEAIEALRPDAILSIHGPLGLVDLDGQVPVPGNFGHLPFGDLRPYPGSLGSYGFRAKNIPVVTIELKNASYMPPEDAIKAVLRDVRRWVRAQFVAVDSDESPDTG